MSTAELDKEILEVALSSPDAAVRRVALRVKELEIEMRPLVDFLDAHVNSVDAQAAAEGGSAAAAAGSAEAALLAVMRRHGKPMKLTELHAAFLRQFPMHCPAREEALRQRVLCMRKTNTVVLENGYYSILE